MPGALRDPGREPRQAPIAELAEARWLGLDRVVVGRRGDLARALRVRV